ncbi:hypothetical protein ABZV34_28095, partial [Streptomyces sp. NPDC005195]|uniref:hypothetical protein n=1 Tax=Streptomyces sp. NPDC005195 TaxID=3154561 RepID=UPI0033B2C687
QYDADRAERTFTAVDPENRMVARTLEARFALPPAAEYSLRSFRASPRELPASGGGLWNWPPAIP